MPNTQQAIQHWFDKKKNQTQEAQISWNSISCSLYFSTNGHCQKTDKLFLDCLDGIRQVALSIKLTMQFFKSVYVCSMIVGDYTSNF